MIKKLIISDTEFSTPQIFHNIEAVTLGELKKELPQINFSGKTILERDSRASLELDDARLPNQDNVVLFLSTKNVKAGYDATHDDYDDEDYDDEDYYEEDHVGEYVYNPKKAISAKLAEIERLADAIREDLEELNSPEDDSFIKSIIDEGKEIRRKLRFL